MSQLGRLLVIDTDPATQFIAGLAQNASDLLSWTPDMAIAAAPDCRGRVIAIAIISDQNLAWELNFWSREAGPAAASVSLDSFLGRKGFIAGDGLQIAGAGSFRYFASGLDITVLDEDPRVDRDSPYAGRLHLSLVNRSATGKNAGATGEIKIRLFVDPTQGQ